MLTCTWASADARTYDIAEMLKDVVNRVKLMTNNPLKLRPLDNGIEIVERLNTEWHIHENKDYLATKRNRMGHILDL